MMTGAVLAPAPVAPVPAAAGAGRRASSGSVLVAVGCEHRHEWVWDTETVGLFFCADRGCDAHAVCPGCLNRIDVALRAPAAGLFVYWCVRHDGLSGRVSAGVGADGDGQGADR